jgi:hypothetical protein
MTYVAHWAAEVDMILYFVASLLVNAIDNNNNIPAVPANCHFSIPLSTNRILMQHWKFCGEA